MYSARRRHPLQTFRFWFFMTGAAAVTLAWRFDLFPFRIGPPETGRKGPESFTEVALSDPETWSDPLSGDHAAPRSHGASPFNAASAQAPPEQSEPGYATTALFDNADPINADNPDQPLAKAFQRSATSRPRAPSTALLDNDHPASVPASENGIVQTASVDNPFAPDKSSAVRHADQMSRAPGVDLTEIDRLSRSNDPRDHIEAHRALSQLYWQQPEVRSELRERIDELAQRIYFQAQPHYMPAYEIQPGDQLQNVGKQYAVPWQYLAKLNHVDPQRIQAGQRLKVIKGPFSAIIDLSDYELTVHAHGYYVTRYSVGIGKDGSTPLGAFTVENKEVDPTYYGPDRVIEHDDPSNPLGERWIDIGNGYGIHGTIDPGSIGKSESRGCIRMHNEDVAAVYDLLGIGSEVTIRE